MCYSKCKYGYSIKCDGEFNECYDNIKTDEYYYDKNELCLKPCDNGCLRCPEGKCSKCKENFSYKIDEKINEIIKACYNITEVNFDYYYYNKFEKYFDKCNNTCKTCYNSL